MRTVLVVNDSRIERQRIVDDLAGAGFIIAGEASDGIDAVSKYRKLLPDVVIMDLIIPGKGGLEIVYEIMNVNPKANVILCASVRNEAIITKALDYGIKYFLDRDYNRNRLIKMAREIGLR